MNKIFFNFAWLLIASLGFAGCDDDSAGESDEFDSDVVTPDSSSDVETDTPTEDAASGHEDDGGSQQIEDAASADSGTDAGLKSKAAWIEVALNPRSAIYRVGAESRLTATAYTPNGKTILLPLTWHVEPQDFAEISEDNVLTFKEEGQGYVYACNLDVCGFAAFYVDAGLPVLTLYSPERGEILGGNNSRTIQVRGNVKDSGGSPQVYVNDIHAELGADGMFSVDLPAHFGINWIEVKANDGVNSNSVSDYRAVLWAPDYLKPNGNVLTVGNAISLRVDQSLLDSDLIPDPSEQRFSEVAQVITKLLSLVDVSHLLPSGTVIQSDSFRLSIDGVDLKTPDIDLSIVQNGLELFVRLPDVRLYTSGEAQSMSLDGYISASVAAFVTLKMGVQDGEIKIEMGDNDIGIAIESISGQNLEDEAAAALVSSLGTTLRQNLLSTINDMVQSAVGDMLPNLLQASIHSAMQSIASIPFNLDLQSLLRSSSLHVEGNLPSLALQLSMKPQKIDYARHETALVSVNAVMQHASTVTPPYDDPGVPALGSMAVNAVEGDGFGASIRLELLNGLLHELWRGRLLELSVDGLPAISHLALSARLPPLVVPKEDGDSLLELQIGELMLDMTLMQGSAKSALNLRMGLGVVAGTDENGKIKFELSFDGDPEMDLTLLESTGTVTEANVRSVLHTVWTLLSSFLPKMMNFELGSIAIPADQLQTYLPNLKGLALEPDFGDGLFVRDGRIRLEGGLDVSLTVDEAP